MTSAFQIKEILLVFFGDHVIKTDWYDYHGKMSGILHKILTVVQEITLMSHKFYNNGVIIYALIIDR